MSEEISKQITDEDRELFEKEYANLKEKLKKLFNNELFNRDNIKNESLIKKSIIESMKSSIESIENTVDRDFSGYLSRWIVNIISTRLMSIEGEFDVINRALQENTRNPEIHSIGYEPNSLTFQEYFEKILLKVDALRYTIEYLVDLNQELMVDARKVLLFSNNELVQGLESTKESLRKEVESFRKNRGIADNAKTEDFYHKAIDKYKLLEDKYRDYFYKSLVIVFSITFFLFLLKACIQDIWGLSTIEFWFLKLSVLAVGITLVSYFIKQSSHYQRLADQNYQTQVELQAYPTFMESIPSNEAASVRKELALKYFGREINSATHKDIGNLVSDQMKSTTDMVKATTEAIKNLNGKGGVG